MERDKKVKPQRRPMSRCERGVWIDTEGSIGVKGVYRIDVYQKEREVLEDYCAGALKDSIPCVIDKLPYPADFHRARITGAPNVAKEIKLTQPCIRTAVKRRQIERFKTAVTRELKYRPRKSIREARKILEL